MSHFNYRKFIRSFWYAWRGLARLIASEQNAQVHLFAAIVVGLAAYYLDLNRIEATIVFFAVALVFAVEITNTAIEKLLDVVHPQSHSQIAYVKDALAGAVLIAASIAVIVGLLVFYPHLTDLYLNQTS
jgi:undecaprenol kinase